MLPCGSGFQGLEIWLGAPALTEGIDTLSVLLPKHRFIDAHGQIGQSSRAQDPEFSEVGPSLLLLLALRLCP